MIKSFIFAALIVRDMQLEVLQLNFNSTTERNVNDNQTTN